MDNTLYCPFMGGNPCMGKSCACAVYTRDAYLNRTYRCGMARTSSAVWHQPIDKEDNK
jgi:hypothetical protein